MAKADWMNAAQVAADVAGYAAVYRPSRLTDETMCFAWGETLSGCRAAAQNQLQVPHNRAGSSIYGRLSWVPLDAEQASEVAEMLDAPWLGWGGPT